ncbi:hypothetical protein [Sphingobacterium endophyticum]|uniref:hypothetical protein n=1 Tax=Sphingobacterium endophyticum TaxID=2546448 RepID=UPI0012E23408|nr:hypothetical protein [Sphingobacterium endophyticum]
MTDREFLKNEVLTRIDKKLNAFGYNLSKSACDFTKKTDFGWNKYQIVFLIREDGWELKPSLLVRFDVVENLFHQISGFDKKYQKGTPTIGTSIESFKSYLNTKTIFELKNEAQISQVVDGLLELFNSVAVPFLEMFDKLSYIDDKLNSNIEDTSLTGGIFKGTKALIIAKLLKRQDFDKLESAYQSYYENFSNGFYLPEFLRLKELLK